MPEIGELRELLERGNAADLAALFSREELEECPRLSSSLVDLPTYASKGERLPEDVIDALAKNQEAYK